MFHSMISFVEMYCILFQNKSEVGRNRSQPFYFNSKFGPPKSATLKYEIWALWNKPIKWHTSFNVFLALPMNPLKWFTYWPCPDIAYQARYIHTYIHTYIRRCIHTTMSLNDHQHEQYIMPCSHFGDRAYDCWGFKLPRYPLIRLQFECI